MAKTKKTARELAAMVMREVRASGKCSDLQSVVVHPTGRNYPTWECATQVNKPRNEFSPLAARGGRRRGDYGDGEDRGPRGGTRKKVPFKPRSAAVVEFS